MSPNRSMSESLQADREVVLVAVRQNRMALRFAARGLLPEAQGTRAWLAKQGRAVCYWERVDPFWPCAWSLEC